MFRRFVRWLISPAAQFASVGFVSNYYLVRDPSGVYLCSIGPFGEFSKKSFTRKEALQFCSLISCATFDHERGLPIMAEPGTFTQFYPAE